MEKKFEHDCNCCTYLGSKVVEGEHYDFYQCRNEIIGRYGNEPQENRAMPKEYCNLHPILKHALVMKPQTPNLSIAQDEQITGYDSEMADIDNPRGARYKTVYWVQATMPNGKRYDHYHITSNEIEVLALKTRMTLAINNGDSLDLDNLGLWAETQSVYGSVAYINNGTEQKLLEMEMYEDRM